ncbi:bifunctional lysine-specific demethylase and histidyl-hydroxylase NO66 [Topomyia yanbarensis]|uniref:bifunctional lysine-specific demethylase and histidyl-hydroxylase NO66 n=1 Tax=Topomyia yanbarensis TaxID=2498891 RepID=UPI00273C6CA0|nr:bifunctional lysine-specific demethylase and histidyl-hydroxylase NO66 [Topomyia yanbarensis]
MSRVPSIFDTPRPQPVSTVSTEATTQPQPKDGTVKAKPQKKRKSPASKKEIIEQLLQEQQREFDQHQTGGSEEPPAKKRNTKDTSTSSTKSKDEQKDTSKQSKKKKPSLKIKLRDVKKHKQKLRKSLNALNNSRAAHQSDNLIETSFDGQTLRNNSNHSTPVTQKTKISKKKKSRIMPQPLEFTPKKIAIKQEPKTPGATKTSHVSPDDSVEVGRETLAWVIQPISVADFMAQYWEKKPLLIQRNDHSYYSELVSRAKIDEMLRKHNIEYTKNIDVTSYREGKRETHNPDGRVLPPDMWSFYNEGCSIRMLNPQTCLRGIYKMNVKLQEFFHCMTGANFYLTPPNSQGFAPHYDDIEAFVLQVEGRKHWKLYSPRTASEVLPRVSSPNFIQEEIGVPILEVVLEPGDLLYFPRGIIHQASTVPGHHSLHVTMSVYQKNSWADFLELFLPHALAQAADSDLALRQGIPRDLHQHFGIVFSDNATQTRKELIHRIKNLVDKIFTEEAIDTAVDQMAKRFQHDALPPLVAADEIPNSVYGANYTHNPDGTVALRIPFTEQSSVRLLRRNILRLVSEENKIRIYYHTDNSREYHEYEPNFLEVDHDTALGVELLVKVYPQMVTVGDLPVEDKIEFAKSLWEKGLIVVHD